MKRRDSLLYKFAGIFAVFIAVALILGAGSAYVNQRISYHAQCEKRLVDIADHLKSLVESERRVFYDFQEYLIKHREEILINAETITDWRSSWYVFDAMFRSVYPQKTLGIDISFNQMIEDVQRSCAIYLYKKWSTAFSDSARNFGIHSVTYLVPSQHSRNVYTVVSSSRTTLADDPELVELCREEARPNADYATMWQSWSSRGRAVGYDIKNVGLGQVYAYYATVMLDDQRIGIIETEISTEETDHIILEQTISQTLGVGLVLLFCVAGVLYYLHEHFIVRLERLQANVRTYSQIKDPEIAVRIAKENRSNDEISLLSLQISSMIHEIQNYIHSLTKTTQALAEERENSKLLKRLANRDSLTGARNHNAYDRDMERLEEEIKAGRANYALMVVDLNYLKSINDHFGHECGNEALKRLYTMIRAVFSEFRVYRIGGDEFVVLMEHEERQHIEELVAEFRVLVDEVWNDQKLETWERISAAAGYAVYEQNVDKSVNDVFRRADREMYEQKAQMKALRKT